MVKIKSINEAEQILAMYVPQVKELLGKDITLVRMMPLMKLLGNPENKLKIIHVAGTSGKTSTAYYIASLLQASGKKVGLTVSPHLDSVTERVQINMQPLPEAEFCAALEEFLELIKKAEPTPSYFELLVAFAFWYFAKAGVDYAVIETGLGGLHDATNVASRKDKVCVITDIGYDHMHVLGNTLNEIAQQKAGIIKPNNQVLMYKQAKDVNQVFEQTIQSQHAKLASFDEPTERANMIIPPGLGELPIYQQRNWLLAYKTYEFVCSRDRLEHSSWEALTNTLNIKIPGRMELFTVNNKSLIMDGAHNEQKMQAFVSSFQQLYPGKKAAVLLAMKQGKEYETVLPLLLPICSSLIITTFDTIQDLPVSSIEPAELASAAEQAGFRAVEIIASPTPGFKKLLASPGNLLLVTGSFYLLSCVRTLIINSDD